MFKKGRENRTSGDLNKLSKLKEFQVWDILILFFIENKTNMEISRQYNVSRGCIKEITNGRNWSSVYKSFMEELSKTT